MAIWRKRIITRSVYQASDLFSEPNIKECVAWFLPKWAYYVARSFLFDYGQRDTSFAMDYRTGLYLIPDETEMNEIDLVISEALGGDIVCVQDLVNAIEGVTSAILFDCQTSGCENVGSGGAEQSDDTPTQNVDDGINDPTDGAYADYDEYKDNKCGWANKIIDDMLADLLKVGQATFVTWVAQFLVLAFVTPIPFDDVIALVGIGLSLVIGGLILGFSQGLISEIEGNREEFLCSLVNAETPQQARTDFLATSTLGVLENEFLGSWLGFSSLNRLFTKQSEIVAASPCDCGACDITMLAGVLDSVVFNTFTVSSEPGPPGIAHAIVFRLDAPCELVQSFDLVSIDPIYDDITAPATSKSGYIDEFDVEVEHDWDVPLPPVCVKRVNFFSQDGPFSAVFTLDTGVC